jgi:DNA-binding CsgD family transcriptional regulator
MFWNDVLEEVLNRSSKNQAISCANIGDGSEKPRERKITKTYGLGNNYGNIYFTRREAECMVCLLKGKTINKTAEALKLSPRTVEFYLKNMKGKLRCKTKYELVDTVQDSDFLQGIDFA